MNMQIIDDITRFIFIENELEPADAVLIPGGSLAELPQEAAKCWKENLAPIVVPSGKYSIKTDFFHGARSQQDKYPGPYDTEADFYTAVLTDCGVATDAIIAENKARYTQQNALFSRELLDDKKIVLKKAIICCKAFHARRCLMYYQIYFPDTAFMIDSVAQTQEYDISAENWYQSAIGRKKVFGELSRIGTQFGVEFDRYLKVDSTCFKKVR